MWHLEVQMSPFIFFKTGKFLQRSDGFPRAGTSHYPSEGQEKTIVRSGGLNLLCALQYCFIFLLASNITAAFVLVSEHTT